MARGGTIERDDLHLGGDLVLRLLRGRRVKEHASSSERRSSSRHLPFISSFVFATVSFSSRREV